MDMGYRVESSLVQYSLLHCKFWKSLEKYLIYHSKSAGKSKHYGTISSYNYTLCMK